MLEEYNIGGMLHELAVRSEGLQECHEFSYIPEYQSFRNCS